ncbi:hypothetical protein JTB14_034979 [Gonioctena quinquepunctata]|nr:hypothetical protein JTB14_034979 [Gonioctena quinquepunctata]
MANLTSKLYGKTQQKGENVDVFIAKILALVNRLIPELPARIFQNPREINSNRDRRSDRPQERSIGNGGNFNHRRDQTPVRNNDNHNRQREEPHVRFNNENRNDQNCGNFPPRPSAQPEGEHRLNPGNSQ